MVSLIKRSFDNIEYVSYPKISYFGDLPIEYEQRLFTKQPIDFLSDSIIERLKVSLIEQYFDNRIYASTPWNAYFGYLPFDGGNILITRQLIYHINDDILFRLNNGLSVYVKTNRM